MIQTQSIQLTETGRRLGHDLFRYRSPAAAGSLPPSVREGFDSASATGVRAQAPPDRYVKKWLQLRMSAWRRGRAFDEGVTPDLLKAMDVATCPVMRTVLTHGERTGTDWSVDRLNNDGAYAANNLAVISTAANRAKGMLSFDEVLPLSSKKSSTDGLTPAQWLRLASIMLGPCFASKPAQAPTLPLVAPVPLYSVRLAMQQIQHVFTNKAATQSGKNHLIKRFRCAGSTERSEARLRMLAEAVHTGLKREEHAHDVWLQDGVMSALLRWRETLDDNAWGRAGEVSRCLAGSRIVSPTRLQNWALSSRGYLT